MSEVLDIYYCLTPPVYNDNSFGTQEELDSFLECLTTDEERRQKTKELLLADERANLELFKYLGYLNHNLPPFNEELMEWCNV